MGIQGLNLQLTQPAPLDVKTVVLNLLLAAVLAWLLGKHFVRYGSTFSNRSRFARILPTIALTTALVITIVKASLALSLGLVGALSIVRFRTPIKEPEELAYLFLAIATGLGMGADQRLVTAIAVLLILAVLTGRALAKKDSSYPNLYVNIQLPEQPADDGLFRGLLDLVAAQTDAAELRRFDSGEGSLAATFYVDCKDEERLLALQEALNAQYPQAQVSFVEQSRTPGD